MNRSELSHLSLDKTLQIIGVWNDMSDDAFQEHRRTWPASIGQNLNQDYLAIRDQLVQACNDAKQESKTSPLKEDYLIDLRVGLKIYSILNPEDWFKPTVAADDDVWRYMSVCVIPDLTYNRYPDPEDDDKKNDRRINSSRFYKDKRRIWIRTLWWYVHLSWQGGESETFEVLSKLSVDAIEHLIARLGIGYRVKEYRELVKQYSQLPDRKANLWKMYARLNLARCYVVEPTLAIGGDAGFVSSLLSEREVVPDEED